MKKMQDLDLKGKKVLIRADLNVPLKDGKISNDARIIAALPTIKSALEQNAAVMVMAHLGRPTEGEFEEKYSLRPVAEYLSEKLGFNVPLISDYLENAPQVAQGKVVLLENCRFNVGEKKNNPELAQKYADLCDVFISDGFGVVHRAQASTHGVAEKAKQAGAGLLLAAEVESLEKIMKTPQHPLLAIIGGSKVSTKLLVLQSLLEKVDVLITGGGITNTFLAAQGFNVGASLYEADLIPDAKELLQKATQRGVKILLPEEVVVASEFSAEALPTVKNIKDLSASDMILDIAPASASVYAEAIKSAKTIVWNGPVGVFEFANFAAGTKAIAQAIAESSAYSLAGGGDTIAAIEQFGVEKNIDYISTGGGSMLEYLEGKELPGVAILEK